MIGTLTGLRGVALLMVLVAGLAAAGVLPSEFGAGLDQIGLMIAVVLSGHLLARRHGREHWDVPAAGAFLAGRAKRLLPLYYLAVVLSAAVTGWWSDWPYRIGSWGPALRAILLIDAPGPLWIVPVLAQLSLLFVVFWWLWFRQGSTQGRRGLHPFVLVAAGVVASLLSLPLHGGVATPYFLAGVATGLAWDDHLGPLLSRQERPVAVAGALAFVLAWVNLPAVRLAHGWTFGHWHQSATWADPLTALIVLVLVVSAAARPITLAVLDAAPLRWLGAFFYPVYLVVPVLVAAFAAVSR